MEINNEKFVCLHCGNDDIDEMYDEPTCTKCDAGTVVSVSDYHRWHSIKGTIQLFTGNNNQKPSAIIPLHTNKFGWIVAEVINTKTTIFPNLKDIVEYDLVLHKQLLAEHQLEYHMRCIEAIRKDKPEGDK